MLSPQSDEVVDMSAAMRGMWLHEQLDPCSTVNRLGAVIRARGALDLERLEEAMQLVVDRHDVLHAAVEESDGHPCLAMRGNVEVRLERIDAVDLSDDDVTRVVDEFTSRAYDLDNGPLFRFAALQVGPDEHLIALALHHVITDLWSMAMLGREIGDTYLALVDGIVPSPPPARSTFRDHVEAEKRYLASESAAESLVFWETTLAGLDDPVSIPADHRHRTQHGNRGAVVTAPLGATTSDAVRARAADEGTTPYKLVLAAFLATIHRYTGRTDLAVATIKSGRSLRTARVQGCFVNPVVLRSRLDDQGSFRSTLATVSDTVDSAFAHDAYPFQALVERGVGGRAAARRPLARVGYLWQKTTGALGNSAPSASAVGFAGVGGRVGGALIESMEGAGRPSPYDLSLLVTELDHEYVVAIEYVRELYDEATIDGFLEHFRRVLDGAIESPGTAIGDLPILSDRELDRLATARSLTSDPVDGDLVDRIVDRVAERQPEAIAIETGSTSVTFGAFVERTEELARFIRRAGVRRGDFVGLHLGRSVDMVASMFAVWKSGAAFVPLDPTNPVDRLRYMVEDSGTRVVLTTGDLAGVVGIGTEVVIDSPFDDVTGGSEDRTADEDSEPERSPADLAYAIYTSGSTGAPKAVAIEHANLVNLASSIFERPGMTSDDVVLAHTTFAFDMMVPELILPLAAGARMALVDQDAVLDGAAATSTIDRFGVTILQATPSMLRLWIESGWTGRTGLSVWCGAEALNSALAHQLLERVDHLWNAYGPTEAAVWASFLDVGSEWTTGDGVVPLGRPLANINFYVLDGNGRPVPDGAVGELHIGGRGVARGYVNRPVLTAERFGPDPFDGRDRTYRTGDLVRRSADGSLEFRGRADEQVKLRGFRVELGEVAAAIERHPDVSGAIASVHRVADGDERLVAHVVPSAGRTAPEIADLVRFLRRTLPDVMIPSAIVEIAEIPLTPNGKVDRTRIAVPPDLEHGRFDADESLRGIERTIGTVWAEVLGVEVGRDDDFFDLGGHSLLATRIASRLSSRFGRRVDIRTVFENPTVAELARVVEATEVWRAPRDFPQRPNPGERAGPLTYSQERMWFLHHLNPTSVGYNVAVGLRLIGPIDVEALRASIAAVVARHESLRTRFELDGETPVQIVDSDHRGDLELIDCSGHSESDRWEYIEGEMERIARRTFDLARLPLTRFVVFRGSATEFGLLLVQHHIVSDQWSLGILAHEIAEYYRSHLTGSDVTLPEVDVQLIDYAHWHRELVDHDLGDQLDYWRSQLADLAPLDLPTDHPRPKIQSGDGATLRAKIPPELVDKLDAFCAAERVTPFMALIAGFQVLLSRYADTSDIAVGTAIANRNWMESERLIGSLVNSVVIRSDVRRETSFRAFLGQVRSTALDAFAHQDVPFARVVSELQPDRDLGRSPLFQTFFNVQNAPFEIPNVPGAQSSLIHLDRLATQFDLTLSISTIDNEAAIEYDTDLFDRDRIVRMLDHYWVLVDSLISDPDGPIGLAQLVTDAELEAIELAQAPALDPIVDHEIPHRLFERRAATDPDRIAARDGSRVLTYGELDTRANVVARLLAADGVQRGSVVGVMVDRSIDMVATVLGLLKLGAPFVPLDASLPPERLAFVVDDASVEVVVASASHVAIEGVRVFDASTLGDDPDGVPLDDLDAVTSAVGADDLAYIIYTSGSTGRPKGVRVAHRSLAHYLQGARSRPGMREDDRVLAITPLTFDPSIHEIVLPLIVGAEIVIVPRDVATDGARLREVLENTDPTIVQATPTTWRMLIETGWQGGPHITALSGGEVLAPELAHQLRARARSVWNLYGPTETTLWATAHEVGEPADVRSRHRPVPVGTSLPGVALHVLDPWLQPVPSGVPGELYIGGGGVTDGYLNRDAQTAQAFIDDVERGRVYRTGDLVVRRADGALSFIGRRDGQIKLRGHRIELGEIEAVLVEHPDIAEVAVVAHEFDEGDQRLVAYVRRVDGGGSIGVEEIRHHLRPLLPDHMIPALVVVVDEFPRTSSNKIDRRRLPEPTSMIRRPLVYEAPRTETERRIARIWSDLLKIDDLGRDDNFFEHGGHSLLAIRLFARLEEDVGRNLPLAALFEAPTIRELAALVDDEEWEPHWTSVVPVRSAGARPPLFYVAAFQVTVLSVSQIGRHLPPGQPFYAIQPQGIDSGHGVDDTIEEIAAAYVEELRRIQPLGPYVLGGHCSGSWVAFEIARQLQDAGEDIALLVLVDYGPPGEWPGHRRPVRHLIERAWFYLRTGRLLDAIRWQASVLRERVLVRRLGRGASRRIAEVRGQHASALANYRPTPLQGDALLVRSRESSELADRDWHLRWGRLLTGDLDIAIVEGSHAGLVENQYSEQLAAVMADAIDRIPVEPTMPGSTPTEPKRP